MIKFESLSLENFGCYKGKTEVRFKKNGINLFIGENGTGKTTLLYAFQYLLTGRMIKTESSLPREESDLIYTNAKFFELILKIDVNEDQYVITKKFIKEKNGTKKIDNVIKNDHILGESDKTYFLQNILHPDIAGFFLFDALSLKKFSPEASGDTVGALVKSQLEILMGLPAIIEAKKSIEQDRYKSMKKELDKKRRGKINDDAKRTSLADLDKQIADTEKSLSETLQGIKDSIERADKYREQVKDNQQTITKIQQFEDKEKELQNLKDGLTEYMEESALAQGEFLPLILNDWIEEQVQIHRQKEIDLQVKSALTQDEMLIKIYESSVLKSICEICNSQINDANRLLIQEKIKRSQSGTQDESTVHELSTCLKTLNTLRQLQQASVRAIDSIDKRIETSFEFTQKIRKLEEDIAILSTEIAGKDKDGLIDANNNFLSAKKEQIEYENARDKIENQLDDFEKRKTDILSLVSTADFIQDENRLVALTEITKVLDKAMDNMRQDLREKIQKGASEIFVRMCRTESYTSLKIDPEKYTLTPVTASGEPYSKTGLNSAAALVSALSFLASLHANSPIKGPLVIDSAFDPLDKPTTLNVLKELPSLTDQILLICNLKSLSVSDDMELKKIMKGKLSQIFWLQRKPDDDKTLERSYITEEDKLPID